MLVFYLTYVSPRYSTSKQTGIGIFFIVTCECFFFESKGYEEGLGFINSDLTPFCL